VIAAAALACVWLAAASAPAAPVTSGTSLGVFRGGGNVEQVARYSAWLGRRVTHVLDYLARSTWTDITEPDWLLAAWQDTPYQLVLAVPMLPDADPGAPTMADGATGAYNPHFRALARDLVQYGRADAVIRLGWEFNGNWYAWSAAPDPGAFVAYWRQIVRTMRAVPGSRLRFEWAPVLGQSSMARVEDAYPGDRFVDLVGMTVYDIDWRPGKNTPARRWLNVFEQPYGPSWLEAFAASRGKPIAISEWGLVLREDGLGYGDNPHFLEQMHAWFTRIDPEWTIYFEYDAPDGLHALENDQFPRAAARFKQLFGPAARSEPDSAAPSPSRFDTVGPALEVRLTRMDGHRVRVRAWAADASGVRSLRVQVGGRLVCARAAAAAVCRTDGLGPGRHAIQVVARDRAGNVSSADRVASFR
jgi:hypothetical protein